METSAAEQIKEVVQKLNEAAKAYYQEDREIMSNFEYDKLYDELVQMEKDAGVVLASSPTVHVGYEAVNELPKEQHESPMLSLDKTKSVDELQEWLKDQQAVLSWKLDGLTIVLTYREGTLLKAVTRGNGEVGEVITNNARVFKNVPLNISYKGELVLRGEAVITYSDFNRINDEIEDVDAKYKNPRNLCSGSVRQLNNEITAKRNVHFMAFALVKADGVDFENSRMKQFDWLTEQGFDVVEHVMVDGENMKEVVASFAERISDNDFPSDGLVLLLDDIEYGLSLGNTSKFPRSAMAFKWADEIRETRLTQIEWSPSRTGLINPVAIFEPVELEGTSVSRASVHNISIMKALQLGVGDTIEVYKANMIIPQIAENLTRSGVNDIPEVCPVCGGPTQIRQMNDVESLYCVNPKCEAKRLKAFTLFVSRDALNIDGLSEMTLEKMIGRGYIHEFADLFHLSDHRDEIVKMEGFGEKSYENLMMSIENARNTTLPRVIYSLGISNIGLANAKMICREYQYNVEKMRQATVEELSGINGIGPVIAQSFVDYFADEENSRRFDHLLKELRIEKEAAENEEQVLEGQVFVITGSVEHFANRAELKELIEAKGGKVTGTVTSKTSYLINNDTTSGSSKNKKARELNVPVISEEEFLALIQ